MRIGFYNQMFALNGQSPISHSIGHLAIHLHRESKKLEKRTQIDRTINTIKESNAELIALAEVLEFQEEELEGKLKGLGYKYIFFGEGYELLSHKLRVKVAVASKIKCKQIEVNGFPIRNEPGGRGGIVNCHFPGLNLDLISVHLALFKKEISQKQIEFLKDYIKEKKGKVILAGDFNLRYKHIKDSFKGLTLVSDKIKTCSVTPIFNWFTYKDLDHILVRGLKKENIGTLKGYSDHKLIYADLQ